MKTMFRELFRFKRAILLLLLTVTGSVAANLALPMYLSDVINTAIPNSDMGEIVAISGRMLLFVLLGIASGVATGLIASVASVRLGKNVRSKVFSKIQYFSQTEFDRFSTSSLITRTNNDVVQAQTFINMFLRVCLMAPIMCIGGIILALAKSRTMSMILLISMPVMIAFGGYQIISMSVSVPIGDVIAVIQYVMQIMMSVMMLSMIFVMYPRAAVSSERINEVLETEPVISTKKEAVTATEKKGYVSFRNVTFTFPDAETPAIEDISFDSAPGEVTAIIGSTGCGKSTLINLIPRFYDVQQGEVLVDGVNVKDMSIEALRSKIGLVPQKAFLFKGTIAENVGYGRVNPTETDIEYAIRIAQSYDFVMAKEGGFEASISQGGTNVSGGQKQRLAIARAIARKPEIYIFDDSFSALDFKTDAALRKALLKEAEQATVILVAQRISTIKNADRILVLEDGRCVGQGRHEELLENCEVYQEIVYSQLSKEEV